MLSSLLYLIASRPDIMFSVCLCARFHRACKQSYLTTINRIFRYLTGNKDISLWYPKDGDLILIDFSYTYYVDTR